MDEKEVTSKPKLSDKRLKLPLSSPLMDTRQLIDALPSYISLYNNSTSSRPSSNSNLDRPSVLKWFSSLTVHQRLSYLTIVDHSFAQLLLQMLSKLRLCGGHGSFIILPDLPSSESPYLPTLCFRKSLGLLARISDSNESSRLIRDSVRFFNSKEGESVRDCSCDVNSIDTVTFSDEFVVNVDRFVKAMDGVSDSGFLGSDWVEVGMDWVEFGWLKAKGYYSLEAFVANRVEVALKLAWLSSNNGKKRGVKLKEKASSVGVAANVYWRKKGCIDWWNRLGREVKSRVLWMVLGKTTKPLIGELLKGAEETVGDKMQFSCKALILGCNVDLGLASMNHSPLLDIIYRLAVLQDIVAMMSAWQCDDFDGEKLFLSSLNSVNSISDYVSRKMRALLMVISLDSTKLELFEEKDLKDPPNKSKKLGATGRKKKGKSQSVNKLNSATNHCNDKLSNGKSPKDNESGCACNDTMEFVNCVKRVIPQEKDKKGHLSIADKRMDQGSTNKKVEVASKKYKKDSRKKKNSCRKIHASSSFQDSSCVPGDSASSLVAVRDDHKDLHRLSDDSGVQEMDTAIDKVAGSAEGGHRPFTECCLPSNEIKDEVALLETEKENDRVNSCGVSPETTGVGFGSLPIIDNSHSDCTGSTVLDSSLCNKADDIKIEAALTHGIGNKGACNGEAIFSSGGPSYEWPSVAPLHFPGYNSQHLPPATDRLHLEVGHNLYNHFQHSTIQQPHQARNSLMDGACGRILSKLPVSLDWPPLVRNINGLTSPLTCNYDPGFISRRQCALQQGFTKKNAHFSAVTSEDDRKYSADFVDVSDRSISQELADEYDSHWVSEEEYEMCAMPCIDYNQYFGGGIMYWNPSDYPAAGFSRPPSMSSDDSSWAWREADMNRTVDDMVSFSSSYTTNGLPSPSGAPFCSPFDSLGPGPQALGYVRPGNEISAKVLQNSSTVPDLESEEEAVVDGDAKSGDSLPYPVLRPIIIPNISRERSRSEFKRGHDLRSPCVPPNRREQPRIKRPPSPVVLCVPHAPRPPPPSPVGNSRKHRGFPTVRSGSSSPRHWGMRGWFHDGTSFEDTCVCVDGAEVVWPSWSNKTFSSHQIIQPIAGALLQDRLIAISQLTHDQDHPDVAFPLQPPDALNCPARKASLPMMHNLLHEEIECFCKKVAAENFIRRPYINWAVKRVTRSLQVLWPRSRTNVFGSNASGLSLPTSDVDLVVCLPPVRNLEPIKEAGILEGRNGIKETCLQHAARYLANQEWVKADSLKTVENTMIPIIMLVVEVPQDFIASAASNMQTPPATNHSAGEQCIYPDDDVSLGRSSVELSELNSNSKNAKSVRMDISFKSPSHTGLQTTELVKQLTEQFPAAIPLALVLKQFLADRSLDQAYSGGLSSYCLVLLIIRFLQHEHHLGRSINQNLGSLFMDFLYFFGNVFDPRQMRISIQGSGIYINRERGYSIDPIYIDDPLFVTNNVGKNCFRIHQCIKAFADAYSALENNLTSLLADDVQKGKHYRLLPKIIPSLGLSE